jgi:hypothetical protein
MRQTSFLPGPWLLVRDGNDTGRAIFDQHYSRYHYADGRKPLLYVGPGQKMVLITPDALAMFVWRKFISMDHQNGVSCAVFRNEGPTLSSDLIQSAELLAWDRWPGERLYTYVDPAKVRHKRDPGRCFLRAGWRHSGWSKGGLRILEHLPDLQNGISPLPRPALNPQFSAKTKVPQRSTY